MTVIIRMVLIIALLLSSCAIEISGAPSPDDDPCIAGMCLIFYDGLVSAYGEPIYIDCFYESSGRYITRIFFDAHVFELRRFENESVCYFEDISDYFED